MLKRYFPVICLFLYSCTNQKIECIDINHIPYSVFSDRDTLIVNETFNPNDIYVSAKYILLTSLAAKNQYIFNVYNKINDKYIGAFLPFGKGKNEYFDFNPNYIFIKKDTIFINTNIFDETVCLIDSSGICPIENRTITKEIYNNYVKISHNQYLGISNIIAAEYVLNTIKNSSIESVNVGKYPKYHHFKCSEMDKCVLYNKYITHVADSIYSFYNYIPLIRKYNKVMKIIKEVSIGEISDFSENAINSIYEDSILYFAKVKVYGNKIYTLYFNKGMLEFVVFNTNLDIIDRYQLDSHITSFDTDGNYAYFLDISKDPNLIFKYRLNE